MKYSQDHFKFTEPSLLQQSSNSENVKNEYFKKIKNQIKKKNSKGNSSRRNRVILGKKLPKGIDEIINLNNDNVLKDKQVKNENMEID